MKLPKKKVFSSKNNPLKQERKIKLVKDSKGNYLESSACDVHLKFSEHTYTNLK